MSLKDNLKKLREQAGYKQAKDFARAAGIPYSSYIVYEKGSWPNEENIVKIATALNLTIDALIGFEPNRPDELQIALQELQRCGFKIVKVPLPETQEYGYNLSYGDIDEFWSSIEDDDIVHEIDVFLSKQELLHLYNKVNEESKPFILNVKAERYKENLKRYDEQRRNDWIKQKFISNPWYRDWIKKQNPKRYHSLLKKYGTEIKE